MCTACISMEGEFLEWLSTFHLIQRHGFRTSSSGRVDSVYAFWDMNSQVCGHRLLCCSLTWWPHPPQTPAAFKVSLDLHGVYSVPRRSIWTRGTRSRGCGWRKEGWVLHSNAALIPPKLWSIWLTFTMGTKQQTHILNEWIVKHVRLYFISTYTVHWSL